MWEAEPPTYFFLLTFLYKYNKISMFVKNPRGGKMRTVEIHECEVCGLVSNDSVEVKRCESQGNHHKFNVGDRVRHPFKFGLEKEKVVRSRITEVIFELRTHNVSYGVIIDPSDLFDYHFENDIFYVGEDKIIGFAE